MHCLMSRLLTIFKIWASHKTRTFFGPFHSHEMHLLSFWAFLLTKMIDIPSLSYTLLMKFPPFLFHIPKPWKSYLFRAEPPRIGHYRESPPPRPLHRDQGATAIVLMTFLYNEIIRWFKCWKERVELFSGIQILWIGKQELNLWWPLLGFSKLQNSSARN